MGCVSIIWTYIEIQLPEPSTVKKNTSMMKKEKLIDLGLVAT